MANREVGRRTRRRRLGRTSGGRGDGCGGERPGLGGRSLAGLLRVGAVALGRLRGPDGRPLRLPDHPAAISADAAPGLLVLADDPDLDLDGRVGRLVALVE